MRCVCQCWWIYSFFSPSFTPRPVAKTAIADVVQKKSLFVCLSLHHLSLDDLFACVAVFSSGFAQFGQRKPCHNSEFLTGQQLPGQAAADQRRINMSDKPSAARWYVSSDGMVKSNAPIQPDSPKPTNKTGYYHFNEMHPVRSALRVMSVSCLRNIG